MKLSIASIAAIAVLAAVPIRSEAQIKGGTARGLVRAGVDDRGRVHGKLKELTHLEKITSLSYNILSLTPDGKEIQVDPKTHNFKFGEQFRIKIEADTNLYLYVFHEGPDGVRSILMPDTYDHGRVPQVKRAEKKIIPDDGTYFEFTAPPGVERVLLFATPVKRPELTPKDAFNANVNQSKAQANMKRQQDKVFAETQKSAPEKVHTQKNIEKVVEANQLLQGFQLRGLRWEPEVDEENKEDGNMVVYGTYSAEAQPEVYVLIELNNKGS